MKSLGLTILAPLTVLFSIAISNSAVSADGCEISIDSKSGDLREPQVLFLSYGRNQSNFIYPNHQLRLVELKAGQVILLACPGSGNFIQGIGTETEINEVEATCVRGRTFRSSGSRFNFNGLSCRFSLKHATRRVSKQCYKDASLIEIGYPLKKGSIRTLEVCRDDETMMTHWTQFRLTTKIDSYQVGYPRPRKWLPGNHYGKHKLDEYYKLTSQISTIARQVGSRELAEKYINGSATLYLARGHLTAKADFVYGAEQITTFWYINSAPQWQTTNAGNWNTLESAVRRYASSRNSDLIVYTGTHGQMTLRDVNGNNVPIFLYSNGASTAFPVPKFFWKIIHDPIAKNATAFVSLNDPWAESITDDMFICNDVSDNIDWINWRRNSIVKGISYACTVDDLRKSVPTIPPFTVKGLLT